MLQSIKLSFIKAAMPIVLATAAFIAPMQMSHADDNINETNSTEEVITKDQVAPIKEANVKKKPQSDLSEKEIEQNDGCFNFAGTTICSFAAPLKK